MLSHCWLQMPGLWHSSSSTQDTWSSAKVNPERQEHWARPRSLRHRSWQPPLFTAHGSSTRQVRPSRASLYLCRHHNGIIIICITTITNTTTSTSSLLASLPSPPPLHQYHYYYHYHNITTTTPAPPPLPLHTSHPHHHQDTRVRIL